MFTNKTTLDMPLRSQGDAQSSITSRELEAGLDQFLNSFLASGEAASRGAILIKSVPSSKLRKSATQPFSARTAIPVSTCYTSSASNCPGLYSLSFQTQDETIYWVQKTENSSEIKDILGHFGAGDGFGQQCLDLRSTSQGLRHALQINRFPVSAPDGHFRDLCQEAGAAHLYGSYINIACAGSPLPVRSAVADLTTIYFHHRGSPRHWIVIPPTSKIAFEDRIRTEYNSEIPTPLCSQFIRHLRIWISPDTLKEWGIDFLETTQEKYQLLFIFPGSYYYGYSAGFSIVESKIHAGEHWKYNGYIFCDIGSKSCQTDNIAVKFPSNGAAGRIANATPATPHPRQPTKRNVGNTTSPDTAATPELKRARRSSPAPNLTLILEETITTNSQADTGHNPDETLDPLLRSHIYNSATMIASPFPRTITASINETSTEVFNISDDEDSPISAMNPDTQDSRVFQLQQENAAILRDLALARSERDSLRARKASYKSRLLEREDLIATLKSRIEELEKSLERQAKAVEVRPWEEMMLIVKEKIRKLQLSEGI